jgi:hypothetical protein
MQAAQTVKQSDPSYNGWAVAAAQFRKAATAFQLAGDLAQAQAANDQAQTLETALNIANRQVVQTANQPAGAGPPAGNVASATPEASGSDKTIPTPCQDLTGKYGCRNAGMPPLMQQPGLNNGGPNQTLNQPRPWTPGSVAPDVQAEIMALANAVLAKSDGDQMRIKLARRLERLAADHHVPLKPQDLACLQPASNSEPKLIDMPLRWHPYQIKKDAIDRSHLCDDVPEGNAKDSCRENKYGQAVMWAEPELAGQCRGAGGSDDVAECAKRKFLNAWANDDGVITAPPKDRSAIPATCDAAASPQKRADSLREKLRAALAAASPYQGADDTNSGQTQPPLAANPVADTPPSPPPLSDENDAYCNYMAREVVRGELTPGGATSIPSECKAAIAAAEALKSQQQKEGAMPFAMSSSETDAAIKKLLRSPEQARADEEQERQERETRQKP